MSPATIITLYRAVERVPLRDKDYLSSQAKGRKLPPNASKAMRDGWDALSAWTTFEKAHEVALLSTSNKWVVRYDIPIGSGLDLEQDGIDPLHYNIRGDTEELKRYLVPGSEVAVRR